MTPHQLIENIDTLRGYPGYHSDLADIASSLSEKAVHFDFNDCRPLPEHYEFAQQLHERDAFQYPFPSCLFTWNGERKNAALVSDNAIFVVGRIMDSDGYVWSRAPYVCAQADGERINYMSLVPVGQLRCDDSRMREIVDFSFQLVSAFTVMLMSKDIEQTTTPVPDKLNKARERKGKPLINERRVISIKPYAAHAYGVAARDFESGKTRAMHLRRGHFRTIRRGRETELTVPVAPCIVNANGNDEAAVAKSYVIKGA